MFSTHFLAINTIMVKYFKNNFKQIVIALLEEKSFMANIILIPLIEDLRKNCKS